MDWQVLQDWIVGLSDQYGVNPVIFAIIYLGAIPFFVLSIAWLVRNRRRSQPIYFPLLSVGFFSASAYVYLFIAGQNIPIWVYGVIAGLLVYASWRLLRKALTPSSQV